VELESLARPGQWNLLTKHVNEGAALLTDRQVVPTFIAPPVTDQLTLDQLTLDQLTQPVDRPGPQLQSPGTPSSSSCAESDLVVIATQVHTIQSFLLGVLTNVTYVLYVV